MIKQLARFSCWWQKPWAIKFLLAMPVLLLMNACGVDEAENRSSRDSTHGGFQCDKDNGGISLPEGFCAGVVADNLGIIRHLAIHESGKIFATQRHRNLNVGGLLLLEDTDNDGKMDVIQRLSDEPGMGVRIHKDYLYFASDVRMYRYPLTEGKVQADSAEIIINAFPEQSRHSGKPFAIDNQNNVFVNIGSNTNACQEDETAVGEFGLDPCPELEQHAGIWKFSLDKINQHFDDGQRYLSGVRNTYALDWHAQLNRLLFVQHGRDHLHRTWPDLYSESASRQLPAEEFHIAIEGSFYGWPYCYYDQNKATRFLAPEYHGDGTVVGRCSDIDNPHIAFPAHFGPNDLLVYQGDMFPVEYQQGVFIAFHGAYVDDAEISHGYQVVFVGHDDASLATEWQVFADDFYGDKPLQLAEDADYRPTGLAVGPDGSLYITDSMQGRVWRVIYDNK